MSNAATLLRVLREGPIRILRSDSASEGRDLALDLFAFAGTVACATVFRWEARDVIWGLWISSLTVGYATIVSTIARGVRQVLGGYRVLAVLGGLGALAFFTVHFGMFHFVHAVFLNGFFPLVEEGGRSPHFLAMVARSVGLFWPLIVASFLSRFSDIFPDSPALPGKDSSCGALRQRGADAPSDLRVRGPSHGRSQQARYHPGARRLLLPLEGRARAPQRRVMAPGSQRTSTIFAVALPCSLTALQK